MKVSMEFFEDVAKEKILEFLESVCVDIYEEDIVTVWYNYTLGNMKALYAIPDFPYYFEATYNKEKNEIYVDCYEKERNLVAEISND